METTKDRVFESLVKQLNFWPQKNVHADDGGKSLTPSTYSSLQSTSSQPSTACWKNETQAHELPVVVFV